MISHRTRQLLLLAAAVVAFAAMVAVVAGYVSTRRDRRDLTFGLEEVDVLLEDGAYTEAAAVLPWLADRATTAGEGMRVLSRAHALYRSTDDARALDEAARTLLDEFPANTSLRSLAVFAAVRSGNTDRALELAREKMGPSEPLIYAWTLLSHASRRAERTGVEPHAVAEPAQSAAEPAQSGAELLLATLSEGSSASDFSRAWRLTGDKRYALDAALLMLSHGRLPDALELAGSAGLSRRWPRFAAGVFLDNAAYGEAARLLRAQTDEDDESLLLLADALMHLREYVPAREIYRELRDRLELPLPALLNLAYIMIQEERASRSANGRSAQRPGTAPGMAVPEAALALIREAHRRYPHSYHAARAELVARTSRGEAVGFEVERWIGTEFEGRARLLALRLTLDPNRRGYEGRLWQLAEQIPSEPVYRFAAWYFAGRDDMEELELVLDAQERAEPTPAWAVFYRGYLAARNGLWNEAAAAFEKSFVSSPSWRAAANAATALFRTGETTRAQARLQDALLLARNTNDPERVHVFLIAARASDTTASMRTFVQQAREIDPNDPEVLLLGTQLDNASPR